MDTNSSWLMLNLQSWQRPWCHLQLDGCSPGWTSGPASSSCHLYRCSASSAKTVHQPEAQLKHKTTLFTEITPCIYTHVEDCFLPSRPNMAEVQSITSGVYVVETDDNMCWGHRKVKVCCWETRWLLPSTSYTSDTGTATVPQRQADKVTALFSRVYSCTTGAIEQTAVTHVGSVNNVVSARSSDGN